MTSFTRTWNPAYEAIPPDSQAASQGASRIRFTRIDTRERLEVDHSWAGDTDDGAHKKVTLVDPLGAKPVQANDETYLYSKDVSAKAELFFEDEDGEETQLSFAGATWLDMIYPVGAIYMSTANTSPSALLGGTWTAIQTGRMLVSETGAANLTAGDVFGTRDAVNIAHTHTDTLAVGSDGAHTHDIDGDVNNNGGSFGWSSQASDGTDNILAKSAGAHTHALTGSVDSAGVAGTDLNMPPYLAVYMWERTA